jgi:hypothetical protein
MEMPQSANYGNFCNILFIILEMTKEALQVDLGILLIISQIMLAVCGSIFYFLSIKKLKKNA